MTQSATGQQCAQAAAPSPAEPGRALRRGTSAGATLALAAVAAVSSAATAQADEAYTVRQGDTVSHIAARSGVSVQAITRANSLADASRIRVGQQLTIPSGSATAPAASAPAPAATAPAATHAVVAGDTVSGIAKRHGTTVAAIVSANNLDSRALIRIGQTLTIPGAAQAAAGGAATATTPTRTASAATHTVVAGDTVSSIAKRHGTTVAAIVSANNLDSRALIRIGQTLTLPGTTAPSATTATTQLVGNTFAGRTYADSVVSAANANKATLLATGVPSKAEMQAKVAATAREMGVDPALALAVAFQESGFNHTAVSPANAIGTMQVIPSSGEWAAQLVGRPINLLDPNDNVVAGVAILRALVKNANDLPTAIAGYYQGASSVKRNGMYADTRRYVANIQTHMARFR
ncbi:LysM peptidoglycan-binding domain-containing protein [Cellulomonas cellasea]|uniref:LysM peptidoglycan-binding domain-containing protein n=1 Tax=Cellulomonas cellasea TaxID=43670 RepID=UPI0025A3FBA7|nr:LysM peptidoglycan-binding domain-containing protein [Cellulomonas cellasea]MDM8085452.1 LysM peptidoglycan-binding domain-containing protein [Cellulomonas cellasea]